MDWKIWQPFLALIVKNFDIIEWINNCEIYLAWFIDEKLTVLMALPVFLVIFGDFSMNTLLELTEFELFEECKIETLTAEVLNILDYCDYLASRAVTSRLKGLLYIGYLQVV